jgi:uncharacterized protein YfaS (alpha-2-macroglobulin family)
VFEPKSSFPDATTYRVSVPAGVKSASGVALAKPLEFSFHTPTVQLSQHSLESNEMSGPEPLLLLEFDQPIDPVAVVKLVSMRTQGKSYATRFATEEEVAAEEWLRYPIRQIARYKHLDRYLVVRPTEPLPGNSKVEIRIAKGMRALVGARGTKAPQSAYFHTYPELAFSTPCNPSCSPGSGWRLLSNNPLVSSSVATDKIRVEPLPDNMKIEVDDNITISADGEPNTTYRITLPAGIEDIFGQTLSTPTHLEAKISDHEQLVHWRENFVVLDPQAPTPITTVSTSYVETLHVELRKVEPRDWDKFLDHVDYYPDDRDKKPRPPLPGTVVFDQKVSVKDWESGGADTDIDLSPALDGGVGQVIVVVESTKPSANQDETRAVFWVQATKLALDAYVDDRELIGWATELATGKPAAGVQLELFPANVRGRTDKEGLRTLRLGKPRGEQTSLLIATRGKDTAFLPSSTDSGQGQQWTTTSSQDYTKFFVFDDRSLYKPGEEVYLKGWARQIGLSKGGDVRRLRGGRTLTYTVFDGRRNPVLSGKAKLSSLGGFDFSFVIPSSAATGRGWVGIKIGDAGSAKCHRSSDGCHAFEIGDYQQSQFELAVQAPSSTLVAGDSIIATATARYYTGGGLSDADVAWSVSARQTSFTPPGMQDYDFGRAARGSSWVSLKGKTDSRGDSDIEVDIAAKVPAPVSITAEARVRDVNRRLVSAGASSVCLCRATASNILRRERKADRDRCCRRRCERQPSGRSPSGGPGSAAVLDRGERKLETTRVSATDV